MEDKTFGEHFQFAMDSVGLPVPGGWFETSTAAIGTISTLITVASSEAAKLTMGQLIFTGQLGIAGGATAGVAAGALKGVAAVLASFYIGACIGAFIYATGMTVSENFSFGKVASNVMFNQAERFGIVIPPEMKTRIMLA